MRLPIASHLAWPVSLAALVIGVRHLAAEETALQPLKPLEETQAKPMRRSHVAVKGGVTTGQSGEMEVGGLGYSLLDQEDDFIFGIEVGYAWKSKRYPFEAGIEFEGSFISSEVNGLLDLSSAPMPLAAGTPVDIHADLNAVTFMVNGTLTLDLWRYRARLGRFLTRLRPYIGGGVGGAQVWFRNVEITTAVPGTTPTADPFSSDEFVFAYQWFGGVEVMMNEKVSLFGEYRELTFEDFNELVGLEYEGWMLGLRINYDAREKK
jgi:opacity protein-like surface antigen